MAESSIERENEAAGGKSRHTGCAYILLYLFLDRVGVQPFFLYNEQSEGRGRSSWSCGQQ
jgi:hypothetical protein